MTKVGVHTIYMRKSHPDFATAVQHCRDYGRLKNGLNLLLRTNFFYRSKGGSTNLSYVKSAGLDHFITGDDEVSYSAYGMKEYASRIMARQNINLPAKMVQSAQADVASPWKSFFALLSNGRIPKPPGYHYGAITSTYRSDTISKKHLKSGVAKPSGWSQGVNVEHLTSAGAKIVQLKVVPVAADLLKVQVLYHQEEDKVNYKPTPGLKAGIDLGVSNLMTIAFSDGREGIIVDGEPLKQINSSYNYAIASLTSKLDKERRDISKKANKGLTQKDAGYTKVYRKDSKRLDRLWDKRERHIKHYYTSATNAIVKQLCSAGVETVYVGWSEGFKQKLSLGRRNNRKFVSIPMRKIVDDLTAKLAKAGISVLETEESYTSKASFIDNDFLPVYDKNKPRKHSFSGVRKTRGEYVSQSGVYINADLNGAYNIIRKCEPNFSFTAIVGARQKSSAPLVSGCVVTQVKRLVFDH